MNVIIAVRTLKMVFVQNQFFNTNWGYQNKWQLLSGLSGFAGYLIYANLLLDRFDFFYLERF